MSAVAQGAAAPMRPLARIRRFVAEETHATGLPIGRLLAAAAVLNIVVTLLAQKPWNPDEHFQILEFAWARAGLAPLAGLPWEFAQRMRPALQPALAMGVLELLRAIGISSPYAWTFVLRLGTLAAASVVLLRVVASVSPTLTARGRRVLWLVALFTWYTPLFLSRFTSENLGGLALALALTFVAATPRPRSDRRLALLMGLAFVFRFQMAFAIVPLLLWLGVYGGAAREGWARAVRVAAGIALVIAASTLLDSWFYGAWVFTPWEYFRINVIGGVAAQYGASPWYAYFVWAPLWTAPPVGVALIGLTFGAIPANRRSPWSWALVGYLAAHLLVAHKELRFLFPLIYFVPVLVAMGWDALERQVRMTGAWRMVLGVLVAQNVALALLLATPAVHRGKDFDWHYFRFLWSAAEARPGRTLYVMQADGDPYENPEGIVNVYRHPRVRGVKYVPGDSIPPEARGAARGMRETQAAAGDELFVVTRAAEPPVIAGATVELAYEAEPGYRVMARWVGAEHIGPIRFLERVDRWTTSEWVRRVYRVRATAGS